MKKLLAFAWFSFLLVAGCSKNDSTPSSVSPPVIEPSVPAVTVLGPQTMSTDQYALLTKSYAAAVNEVANYIAPYYQTDSVFHNGDTWSCTVRKGDFAHYLTATRQSDFGSDAFHWRLLVNGTPQGDTTFYEHWTAMQGMTKPDGKRGYWAIYHKNSTVIAEEFSFSIDAGGVLTAEMSTADENGTFTGKYKIINNPDGSGELRFYPQTIFVESLYVLWGPYGSGTWQTYDGNTGDFRDQGMWP